MAFQDPKEFDVLLDHLAPDRESAGIRYDQIHQRLTKYFQRQNNHFLSAADLADATLDRVAASLYRRSHVLTRESLDAFVFGVAKNIKREADRMIKTVTVPSEVLDSIPHPDSIEETSKMELAQRALDDVLNSLPVAERNVLFHYYSSARREPHTWERREKLANDLGIPVQHLRVYIYRIREKVKRAARARFLEQGEGLQAATPVGRKRA
jgi:DNA-directed RNA polymerase specialized sigma24 family protein